MQAHLTPAHHVRWNDIIRFEQGIRQDCVCTCPLCPSQCCLTWLFPSMIEFKHPEQDQTSFSIIKSRGKNSTSAASAGPLVFFVPVLMVTLLCRRPDAGYGSGSSSSGCGQELSALLSRTGLGSSWTRSLNVPKSTKTIQKHPKTSFLNVHGVHFFLILQMFLHWLNVHEYPLKTSTQCLDHGR